MRTYCFEYNCPPFMEFGPRARDLMRTFGMNLDSIRRRAPRYRLSLSLEPGWICLLTGPNGAGKSILLNAVFDRTPFNDRIRVESIPLESDIALIDALDAPPGQALPLLARAGLADIPALLKPPARLSDGQKWRYRLARALLTDKPCIFADEFCAVLDPVAACAVAWHLRRTADRTGRTFILAGPRTDILTDLAPDVLIAVTPDGPLIINSRQNSS